MGDHVLVVTGRNLIRLRSGFGAPTHFRWIPAHTGGTDLDSVMNSEADRLAGLGARRGPSPPFLANEEDVVFWSLAPGALESPDPLEDVASHISGNFSARLRRGLLDRAMGSLQRLPAQGMVARASPSSLLRILRLVIRSAEALLHLFLMLFSTRQAPTADRHVFGHMRTPAALKCWLCPGVQSALHVFSCPFVVNALAHMPGPRCLRLLPLLGATGLMLTGSLIFEAAQGGSLSLRLPLVVRPLPLTVPRIGCVFLSLV